MTELLFVRQRQPAVWGHPNVDECDFCFEFGEGPPTTSFTPMNRVIYRQGRIIAFSSLGPIVPGHILISPTYHVTASIKVDASDQVSLQKVLNLCLKAYKRHYSQQPVIFEHGDPSGNEISYGQCISHAHLHVMPRQVDMLSIVMKQRELLGVVRRGEIGSDIKDPYLMISQDGELFYFFSASGAPRQYLRAIYSELIGIPERKEWFRFADEGETAADAEQCRLIFQESQIGDA